jgi:hypothetical protein
MAGLRDKTVRVPAEFNARTVDPTNQRGAGQRITGGLAGGRAGKPAGKIAGQAPKPAATKPAASAKPVAKPSGQFKAPSVPKPGTATKPQGTPQAQKWFEQNKPSARVGKQMTAQQVANINKVRQGLSPIAGAASLAGGVRNLALQAVTDTVKPRPTAAGTLSAQGTVSKFANARDKAMAKAKAIKGSPVVGPKAASAPARMSAPAVRSSAPSAPKATAPKASAPKAAAPSGPARMSASTYNRMSGNYGTSRSNNPLMADFKDSLPSKAAEPDVGYSPKTKVSGENIKGAPTDVTKLAFSNPKLSSERTRKIKRG